MQSGQITNVETKRVLCLYRVSSRKQLSGEKDLVEQQQYCLDFSTNHPNWIIAFERQEKAVSGWKKSEKNRNIIQEIRQMALNKEFDVLLVFMYDRIGRKEDETPGLCKWFLEHGIEIWSVTEGQLKNENHMDKLSMYLRFWHADQSSEDTSIRVTNRQQIAFDNGEWTGGAIPWGFKLVPNGKIGKGNRMMMDLIKDEEDGRITSYIYSCLLKNGMGSYRLADQVNTRYPNPNKVWTPRMIIAVIKNPINIGRFQRNGILSSHVHEELRYVTDLEWDAAQQVLANHIYRKYPNQDGIDDDPDELTPNQKYGARLLSGIIFCEECGARLTGGFQRETRNGADRVRKIYRDYKTTRQSYRCKGQTIYFADKVEASVLMVVRRYFTIFNEHVKQIWDEQFRLQMKKKQSTALIEVRNKLTRLTEQHGKLKDEIMLALMGESSFDKATLQGMLNSKQAEIDAATAQLQTCEKEEAEIDGRVSRLSEHFMQISESAELFDQADDDQKKMILSQMIERITISRGYRMNIHFYIAVDEFREMIRQCQEEGYVIRLADGDRIVSLDIAS